jgi:hypothetical protein
VKLAKIISKYELTALATLLGIFYYNNRGFFSYFLNISTIKNIYFGEVFFNLIYTPLLFIAFIIAFWAAGRFTLSFLYKTETPDEYSNIFYIAAGMGLFNIIFTAFGALGILYPIIVPIQVIPALFLALYYEKTDTMSCLGTTFSSWQKSLLYLIGLSLAYNLIIALSAPVSWDELAYHLTIPALYAKAHKIYFIPWMLQQQCITGMEMLNTACLLINNDLLPRLFSVLSKALLLSCTFIFAKKHFSLITAWISVSIIAVFPVSLSLAGVTNNDFHTALFSILAIICLWEYLKSRNNNRFYLTAIFSALAITAKTTGLMTALWIIVILFFDIVFSVHKTGKRKILIFVLLFVSISFPVLLRNYIFKGNPVFPLLYSYINPSSPDTAVLNDLAVNDRMTTGTTISLKNFLSLPYHLFTKPENFGNEPQYFTACLLLGLILRTITLRKIRFSALEIFLSSYILYFIVVWFFFGRQFWRFLLPILPFLCMLIIYWADLIKLRMIIVAMLLINVVPLLKFSVNNNLFSVFAVPSRQFKDRTPKEVYLNKSFEPFQVYDYANKNLPADARILIFREMRCYYLNKNFMWADPLNQSVIMYDKIPNEEALNKQLKALGITHIIVNENIYPLAGYYYNQKIMNLMYGFISKYCIKTLQANNVFLFKIKK